MDFQEEFNKLDLKKCLVGGLVLLGFYYLLFYDSGAGLDALTAQADASLTKNRTAMQRVRQALEDKAKFEEEIKDITRNMQDFQKYFSTDMDMNKLQGRVSQLAEQHSLVVNNLKPSDKPNEFPKYKETAVEFKIEGPFHSVMEFISSLTKQERAIDFSQMVFKTTVKGDYPLVELTTVLVVYTSAEMSEGAKGG